MEYDVKVCSMRAGMEVEGFYLLQDASIRQSSAGKPYLNCSVSDASGSIEAKMWDYSGTLGPDDNGKVIKIRAEVQDYKGAPQLKINRLRAALPEDTYDISALVPAAPIDAMEELDYVRELVESIEDEDYRVICEQLLDRPINSFSRIPAGKSVHHSFLSGLLMHTGSMLRIADFLSTEIYPYAVDRSLLLAGTLLHDFAKEREYAFSELGLITDTGTDGMLLGHPFMGAEEVRQVGIELNVPHEKIVLLQHMLLSHHGKPEFGAAVLPLTAEAELLSEIDMMDSRMEIYAETFETLEPGQFSKKIFALDKKIYRHE